MKKIFFNIIIIIICAFPLYTQEQGAFAITLSPGVNIPLLESSELFSIGGGSGLHLKYNTPFMDMLQARGGIDYSLAPTLGQENLQLIGIDAGAGADITIIPQLDLNIFALAGYYISLYRDAVGSSPFIRGGIELSYLLDPSFSLGLAGSYNYYFSPSAALNQNVGIYLCVTYHIGAGQRKPEIEIKDFKLHPVFPVFCKYYDENSLGELLLINKHAGPIKDVVVNFYVKQYMDSPKLSVRIDELKQNEQREIPLYALFSDNIITVTEATKAQAEITIEYSYLDSKYSSSSIETLRIYDRNAMTWDDDRKAASFVTSKDPTVLRFSKNYAASIEESTIKGLTKNFRVALGLFEALHLYGIRYIQDPKTPYAKLSESASELDFLQFPVQTMEYKAGDCDDLSILYCALLESVGIETAFITVPGHIFLAFSLDMEPTEANALFSNPDNIISMHDKAWIPVEITMLNNGFLQAWEQGTKEWRTNKNKETADFYPIHTAWELYEPVGIASQVDMELPSVMEVKNAYNTEFNEFIEKELRIRTADLNKKMNRSEDKLRLMNKMGLLYAQYGKYQEAEAQFKQIIRQNQYAPALVNLGNLAFLKKDYNNALQYFNQALKLNPDSPLALLGTAKANFELDKMDLANQAYQQVAQISPNLADKYSYLISGSLDTARASSMEIREQVEWEDE